jgi:hypothetical protein
MIDDTEYDTIICKECGMEVFRFTAAEHYPETWDKDTCALCNWISTNNKLTEEEKEEFRKRFQLPKTHGS